MTYRIEYTPAASRQLAKFHKDIQTRFKPKIESLAETPRPPDAKKLQGFDNYLNIYIFIWKI